MTPDELKRVIDCSHKASEMWADPDLTGDVLLLALAILETRRIGETRWGDVRQITGWSETRLRAALHKDLPRYEPSSNCWNGPCEAPMIRRDGPCGTRSSHSIIERHPQTGELIWHWFCSRHKGHASVLHQELRSRPAAPTPAQNAGGILERYFSADWDSIWRWVSRNPNWQRPPKGEPLPARPKLMLIIGDLNATSGVRS